MVSTEDYAKLIEKVMELMNTLEEVLSHDDTCEVMGDAENTLRDQMVAIDVVLEETNNA